jgi:type IV secretion system protein TrbC
VLQGLLDELSVSIRFFSAPRLGVRLWCCPSLADAATSGGGGGLPWEDPLQRLVNSLRGPVAFAISMLGLIAGGAMLIFGAEINDFVRRLIMLVLVISLLVFSGNILSNLFGVGAVVY